MVLIVEKALGDLMRRNTANSETKQRESGEDQALLNRAARYTDSECHIPQRNEHLERCECHANPIFRHDEMLNLQIAGCDPVRSLPSLQMCIAIDCFVHATLFCSPSG